MFLCIFREEEPKFQQAHHRHQCVIYKEVFDGTNIFHIVYLHKKPYILSQEISKLFWKSNVLQPLLEQKGVYLPKLTLSKEMDAAVFLKLIE